MKKIKIYTLGCKLNFAESSTFHRDLLAAGFEDAEKDATADVVIVNTCSVTADADKKCRNIIRRVAKENPGASIVVTGCFASLSKAKIEQIDGVSAVIPNSEKSSVVPFVLSLEAKIEDFFRAYSTNDRTRSFLKVQDGCSFRCSYCTIPAARGISRNIPIKQVVEDAEVVAKSGLREIVLTGVNIGDFGKTTGESFLGLLKALDKVDGIERYRISSIEPIFLTEEIVDFVAKSSKFMPHFHIPLQSGSDRVLRKMHRPYTRQRFADCLERVREYMPDSFFGVDVIVGFPTETEEDFSETYNFLSELSPAFLHVFPFSSRPGTEAASIKPCLSVEEKEQRVKRLIELSDSLHKSFLLKFLGETRPVLFESNDKNGMMTGYTDNYIRVELPFCESLIGNIQNVKLSSLSSDGLCFCGAL